MLKYIFGYTIGLLIIYIYNDTIVDLLSDKQAMIKVIELTLPLTVPSLVYFYGVNRDRQERMEREEKESEKLEKEEKDKFEKSLPYFSIREGLLLAKNPLKAPILNVKIQIETEEDDFFVLDIIDTSGSISSEHCISLGGMVDGDEKNLENLLKDNHISNKVRWLGVSATTITNDNVYYIYIPDMKLGWHFYKRQGMPESAIETYIGNETYNELAKSLAMHIAQKREVFSYRNTILNDAVKFLENNELQNAFAELIILVRNIKTLKKSEKLYILHQSYIMMHYLEKTKDIEPHYFTGNIYGKSEFSNKYKRLIENNQYFLMTDYLFDIIERIKEDKKVSLQFWLRNVEVYIRNQSIIINQDALKGALKNTVIHLVGE